MKKIRYILTAIILMLPILPSARESLNSSTHGIAPSHPRYFLDHWSEKINEWRGHFNAIKNQDSIDGYDQNKTIDKPEKELKSHSGNHKEFDENHAEVEPPTLQEPVIEQNITTSRIRFRHYSDKLILLIPRPPER